MSESEFEPGEGEYPYDARILLTRFATSPLSTLSHKGEKKKRSGRCAFLSEMAGTSPAMTNSEREA